MTLVDRLAGPDGDLLALHRLLAPGVSEEFAGEEHLQALKAEMQSATRLRELLELRRADGFQSMTVMGERVLFEALGRKGSDSLPTVLPIVPNLQGFMRDAVEYGMVGAGVRRAWRVGPLGMATLGLRGLGRMHQILKRDFPAMLRSFVELELADFDRYQPPVVLLQAQVTDLALALHQPRIIEAFRDGVQERTGAHPGLVTCNFGAAISALKSWGIEVACILAPWDAEGHLLRPTAESCMQAVRAAQIPVWAERAGHPAPPGSRERLALQKAGLVGVARDDLSLWSNA